MSARPIDILTDALATAEANDVPRKHLAGGSKAQLDRLGRMLAGSVDAVDLGAAIELARNLPVEQQADLVRKLFPALHVVTEPARSSPADLLDNTATAAVTVADLNARVTAATRDGHITPDERTSIRAAVAATRAALTRIETTLDGIPAARTARRNK